MEVAKVHEIDKKDDLLNELSVLAHKNNDIPPELHTKYNTKRGLRNSDGTGVLVGLTKIGDVIGYTKKEGKPIPTEGELLYRGISVNDIVNGFQNEKRYGFEEVCYLLLFGELPNAKQLAQFEELLASYRQLPMGFADNVIFSSPSNDIMNALARSILACYSYDPNPDDLSIKNVLRQCIELIARVTNMVAYAYQAKQHYHGKKSLYIHYPKEDLGTAENLLHMIRSDNSFTQLETELLDLALVLHAEHGGGNNSTFVVHVVSSTGTDTYSTIAAAVGSLKGPKHGGANAKVMAMIEDIKHNVKDWTNEQEISDYLVKIVRGQAYDNSGLIYGMGHAVYTLSDPRAVLLKKKAAELAKEKNMEDEFALYDTIERVAPKIFAEIKGDSKLLSANVDFYSGFVYKMLDIPQDLYTPIFAIARMAGWSAHRIEELVSGGRIIRPAYKNVIDKREYIPMEQRQ